MHTCLISYGSNLHGPYGSPIQTVIKALDELSSRGFAILKKSKTYSSLAFPDARKPKYLNGCVKVEVEFDPQVVLNQLKEIEWIVGRKAGKRWDSRICDLDLLCFDNFVLPDEKTFNFWKELHFQDQMKSKPNQLLLPHPRIQDRAFVLKPLKDIEPEWMHPVLNQSIDEMLDSVSVDQLEAVNPISPKI